MRTIWVHCYREGVHLKSYDLGVGETLNDAAVRQPTTQELEGHAKNNLTNEGLAFPPYAGISFVIEYPR
jgi:hypothetical protein